jgi:hypothetical protein
MTAASQGGIDIELPRRWVQAMDALLKEDGKMLKVGRGVHGPSVYRKHAV